MTATIAEVTKFFKKADPSDRKAFISSSSSFKTIIGSSRSPQGIVERLWEWLVPKISYDDLMKLLPFIDRLTRVFKPNDNSRNRAYSNLRRPVRALYGKNSEKYRKVLYSPVFGNTKEERKRNDARQASQRDKANRKRIVIDGQAIDLIISKLWANHPTIQDKIILAQLLVGPRKIELLNSAVSKFTVDGKRNIRQTGTAKEKEGKQRVIIKPVLSKEISPVQVVDLIDQIRHHVDNNKSVKNIRKDPRKSRRQNEFISSIYDYGTKLSLAIKDIVPQTKTVRSKSHILRKIYGGLSYARFATGASYNIWLQDVLGHDSAGASLHYTNVNIKPRKVADPKIAELEKVISDLRAEIKELRLVAKDPDVLKEVKEPEYPEGPILKRPHKRESEKEKLDRALDLIKEMVAKGKAVTVRNVRQFGFGSRVASTAVKLHRSLA